MHRRVWGLGSMQVVGMALHRVWGADVDVGMMHHRVWGGGSMHRGLRPA